MTLANARFALRTLRRHPAFTVVAAGTLALGVGAMTAIFSVANAVLLRSLPYPDADRLATIWQDDRTDPSPELGNGVSTPNFRDIQSESSAFESVAQVTTATLTLSGMGPAETVPGARASRELFHVMGAEPVLGRTFSQEETRYHGPAAVVVGHAFWRTRLGADPGVLGRSLMIGGEAHPIIGVAPEGFDFPAGAQLWVPVQNDDEGCARGCVIFDVVGRLAPGASMGSASSDLGSLASRLEAEYPEANAETTFRVTPLMDVMVGEVRTAIWVLFGAVAMVLLVACANVANLMLVRGGARRTELAVRTALGARRRRLLGQLMVESGALALVGGLGGVLLAWWGIWALVRLAPPELPRFDEVALDGRTLAFSLAVAGFTVLVFGLLPALRLSAEAVGDAVRQGSRGAVAARGSARSRSAVLVAEVALAVMLLLAAGLMVRSLVRMRAVDLGLSTDDLVVFRLSLPSARYPDGDARMALLDQLDDRLSGIAGVEAASEVVALPFGRVNIYGGFTRPELPPPAPADVPVATYRALDPDAFQALGLTVTRGRAFDAADRHDSPPVAMINQTAAATYWPGEDPVGKTMDVQVSVGYPDDAPRTIVGVVRDFRSRFTGEPGPEMYVPYAQAGAGFPHILLKTRPGVAPAAVLAAARSVLTGLDPELPLSRPSTLHELVATEMAAPRFYMLLLTIFAALAVALAAVGIYGVVAYLVVQRTREIGVRIALGASAGEVVRMVVWQGGAPALAGVAIGLVGALALGRVLAGILYHVKPTDPVTYVLTGAALLAVVLTASAIPARRATRIEPGEALRVE